MQDSVYKEVLRELRDEIKQFGKGRLLNALEPGEKHDPESGEHTSPHHIANLDEHMQHHKEDPEDEEYNDKY